MKLFTVEGLVSNLCLRKCQTRYISKRVRIKSSQNKKDKITIKIYKYKQLRVQGIVGIIGVIGVIGIIGNDFNH